VMRHWIVLVEGHSAFFDTPFIQAVHSFATEEGAGPPLVNADGVRWSTGQWNLVLQPHGNNVCIDRIQTEREYYKQGIGERVLTMLCQLADQFGITLDLISDESNDGIGDPPEDGEADERDHWLQGWYGRHGFEYTGDVSDWGPWMERMPI
jgi:GNAT superfamily N-acetyltransferase